MRPGGSLDAQLDALIAQLISATARPALQLQNFGMVVDDIGSCRHAWSQAILAARGTGDGPAHAMATCGAPQALAHAQQLGANDFVLGLVFLFCAFSIGLFVWYVGIEHAAGRGQGHLLLHRGGSGGHDGHDRMAARQGIRDPVRLAGVAARRGDDHLHRVFGVER